jgi:integrase/recombinase XerC
VREFEEAMRDKSYRGFPVGEEWGRFLRAKRLEGDAPATISSYETVGRMFTLRHADFESLEPFAEKGTGPELVLDFIERYWGEASEATRIHRFAVLASFFEWAYRTDRVSDDPMRKIKRPRQRRRGPARERIPEGPLARLVSGQETTRDAAAILLLARLGLRREDLRLLRVSEIDLARDEVYLRHAKGGEEHVLPIGFRDLREALYLELLDREALEYLLYPKRERTRPFSRPGIAAWFERCSLRAGVPGYTMHQLRHAAADDLRRRTGSTDAAKMLLRHESVATTEMYLHPETEDLRRFIRLADEGGSGV